MEMSDLRELIKEKKRIVVKIGSSSLQHKETGDMDYIRLEKLEHVPFYEAFELCAERNEKPIDRKKDCQIKHR